MTEHRRDPAPLTLADLEATPDPRPEHIVDILLDHADSATHIQAEVITAAIERANPCERVLLDIQEAAVRGIVGLTPPVSGEQPYGYADETLVAGRDQYAQVIGFAGRLLEAQVQ